MTAKIKRTLQLLPRLAGKSLFLFGPRATGKTSLIKDQLEDNVLVVDLLKSRFYLPLSHNPDELSAMIRAANPKFVVIDEIQKLPILLDEVHSLIESTDIHFLLTGSSARRLKKQNANMLGGRASKEALFPLTWFELTQDNKFDLDRYLQFGSLPRVYFSDQPADELFDYVDVYLKDEILSEAAVRNLPAFSRFLKTAALCAGEILNYASLASDVGLSANTIKEYFAILDDTLLGFQLPPWKGAKGRKSVAKAKHYLFDCGVLNTLAGTKTVDRNSNIYGTCFEHFIVNEVRAYNSYRRKNWDLSFWRTEHAIEVDLIINDEIAIEIKSTKTVTAKMKKGLEVIGEESPWRMRLLVTQDPVRRTDDSGIQMVHFAEFLEMLWGGDLDRVDSSPSR
jgi:predicted AAA+ superfamily ATPase